MRMAQTKGAFTLRDMPEACGRHLERFALVRSCHEIQTSFRESCLPSEKMELALLGVPSFHMHCQALRLLLFDRCGPVRHLVARMEAATLRRLHAGASERPGGQAAEAQDPLELDLSHAEFDDDEEGAGSGSGRPSALLEQEEEEEGGDEVRDAFDLVVGRGMELLGPDPAPARETRYWPLHRSLRERARRALLQTRATGQQRHPKARFSMFSSFLEAGMTGAQRARRHVPYDREGAAEQQQWTREAEEEEAARLGQEARGSGVADAGLTPEEAEAVQEASVGTGGGEEDEVDAGLSPAAQQLRLVLERAELVSTKLGNFLVERNGAQEDSLRERVRRRDQRRREVGGYDLPAADWELDVVDEGDERDPEVGNPLKFAHERERAEREAAVADAAAGNGTGGVGEEARFRGVGDTSTFIRPAEDKCDLESCKPPPPVGTAAAPPPGDGLIPIRFVEPSQLCNLGRSMFPRRGHTMTSLATGRDLLVFGGYGVRYNVESMADTSERFANASIVEKVRMRHVTYGDTHMLKSIYDDPDKEYRKYGIGRYFCDRELVGYDPEKDTWNGEPRDKEAHPGEYSDLGKAAFG